MAASVGIAVVSEPPVASATEVVTSVLEYSCGGPVVLVPDDSVVASGFDVVGVSGTVESGTAVVIGVSLGSIDVSGASVELGMEVGNDAGAIVEVADSGNHRL